MKYGEDIALSFEGLRDFWKKLELIKGIIMI